MRLRKMFLSFITALLIVGNVAFADDISLKATVDANQINLGESTHLVLTVSGTQKADPVQLPAIDGFETRYLGPQTQVSIVNGNYSASKSFIYLLFSNKTGTFTIPSLTVNVDGKDLHSDPITVTVTDAPSQGAAASTSGAPTALSLQDKIMLTVETPKTEVYLHEQVPLHVKLFYGGVNISDVQYPSFDTTGMTKTDFSEPEQNQQVLNGMGFNVVDFKTLISPTRAGELTIGPAQLQANLLYKTQAQGPSSMFGDDIFNNFFTSYDRRPFTVRSSTVKLNVLDLPQEEKPENFSGAVGQYDFTATATPELVKVGDPITLRMKVTGVGDLKTITMPTFSDPSFKVYDPQIKDEAGSKVLEQVIVPTRADIKEVPAVNFSYFDTQTKQYRTVTQGPFKIVVSAPDPGDEFKAVGFEAAKPTVTTKEHVGRDIVFIKEHLDDVRMPNDHFYEAWWFLCVVFIYICAWGYALFQYFVRQRLSTDERFARKLKAPLQARQGLERSKTLMEQNDPKGFYAAAVKTLTDYIGNRLHVSSGGLTADGVRRLLNERSIDPKILADVQKIFDTADAVRFASVRRDRQAMNHDLEELKGVIARLEKVL